MSPETGKGIFNFDFYKFIFTVNEYFPRQSTPALASRLRPTPVDAGPRQSTPALASRRRPSPVDSGPRHAHLQGAFKLV